MDPAAGSASLDDIASRHAARWALRVEDATLAALMERFAESLTIDDTLTSQALTLLRIVKEAAVAGRIETWPASVPNWPIPTDAVWDRALDAIVPPGKAIVLAVFERGELSTCVAARRGHLGFEHILGPARLRDDMGLISGEVARDYRHLVRAVEARVGELSLGCFAEVGTFRQLLQSPTPGAWAAAIAARDVILSPVPPAMAIPLGLDVGRAAVVAIRGLAERMGAAAWLTSDGPLGPTFARVRSASEALDLEGLLGFDPLQLLRKLLEREPPSASDEAPPAP